MAYENPSTDAYVIDGPASVHEYKPTVSNTYGQYCNQELTQKVKDIARGVDRVDLLFDVYRTPSIKRETRESRRSGIRVSVRSETHLVKSTQGENAFLKNDQNKTELFELFVDMLIEETNELPTIIVAMKGDIVLSNNKIQPCFQEEADTRILLHVNHVARSV